MTFTGIIYDQIEDFMDRSRYRGTEAEKSFVEAAKKEGYECVKSERNDDMRYHWDYEIRKEDISRKVDIKAMKKVRRDAKAVSSYTLYVEFKNINGHKGWLYGEADIIAFEQPDCFVVVFLQDLRELAERLVKDEWCETPALYKKYRRESRPKECTSMITMKDVKTLNYKELKK